MSLTKMFRSVKHDKPLAQVLRDKNSRNRFISELSNNDNQLMNRSLDTVQSSLKDKKPGFKQTKLYIRRSLKRTNNKVNDTCSSSDQFETKTELFIMPSPKMKALESKVKLNNTICGVSTECYERPSSSSTVKNEYHVNNKAVKEQKSTGQDVMNKPGRNMLVLIGKADFVLKISKMYPNINTLWDIYGKLMKVSDGKNRYEHILLIRNSEGNGPVLQCIYYDFDNTLEAYKNDSNIRVVGQITGFNRLRIFKLKALNKPIQQSSLMRIQNINYFVLQQNQNING